MLGFVKVGACVVEQVVPADPPPLPPGGWSFRARRRLGAARALFMARRELVNKIVCIVWCVCVCVCVCVYDREMQENVRENQWRQQKRVCDELFMYVLYVLSVLCKELRARACNESQIFCPSYQIKTLGLCVSLDFFIN